MSKRPQHWVNRENPYIAQEIDRYHDIVDCRESRKIRR